MNLLMRNLEIKQVESGNRIAGQDGSNKYLRYDLKDPLNPQVGYPAQVSFNKGVIADYEAVLPERKGGKLPNDDAWTEENIPIKLRQFTGAVEVTYDLKGEYCMLYSADIEDANGNVIKGKHKGDVICGQNGMPKIYTSVSVICRQTYEMEDMFDDNWDPIIDPRTGMQKQKPVRDANGNFKKKWLYGFTPEIMGESRKNLMVPYDDAIKMKLGVSTVVKDEVNVEEDDLFNDNTPEPTAEQAAAANAAS